MVWYHQAGPPATPHAYGTNEPTHLSGSHWLAKNGHPVPALATRRALACDGLRWDPAEMGPLASANSDGLSEARDKSLTRCAEKGAPLRCGERTSNV